MIGRETREQILAKEGRLPDGIVACVGAGSNAIGIFTRFWRTRRCGWWGSRPPGTGSIGQARGLAGRGTGGILHGSFSYVLQDEDGQIQEAHSVSAGLDYPSVGPEHAYLKDIGRVTYTSATDDEALTAFQTLSRLEGIIPALESSACHRLPAGGRPRVRREDVVVVSLSGRGDKDVYTCGERLGSDGRERS